MAGVSFSEEWHEVSKTPSLTIYARHRPGSSLEELGERDYTIRVCRESRKGEDGATAYYSHWQIANAEGPPPRPGVNRVNINEGSWLLEPVGDRTRATYILYTDGGGIPAFLANIANKQSIAQLFEALRARVLSQK